MVTYSARPSMKVPKPMTHRGCLAKHRQLRQDAARVANIVKNCDPLELSVRLFGTPAMTIRAQLTLGDILGARPCASVVRSIRIKPR
jgi:hypothetical protein